MVTFALQQMLVSGIKWRSLLVSLHAKRNGFPVFRVFMIGMICFLFFHSPVTGQKKMTVISKDENGEIWEKFKEDSSKISSVLTDKILKLQARGYTTAQWDTLRFRGDTCEVSVYKGRTYTLKELKTTNSQKSILESSGMKWTQLTGKAPDSMTVLRIMSTLVNHRNNNGYPFARASLRIVNIDSSNIEASVDLWDGPFMWFDTLMTEGRLVMSPTFYSRLLDIKRGDPYDHEKVIRSARRLRDLPYLSLRAEPTLRFINDRAHLYFMPDPQPASRFDFLIGVLPQVQNGVRRFEFAIDFTAEMYNNFRQGEYSYIQIKRLMPENLELIMKSTIPYIGGLPIGSHVDFRLFRNANSHLDLYFDGGAQWLFRGLNQVKIFASYRSSSLIDIDTERLMTTGKLPAQLDVTYSGAGMSLNLMDVDYRFNPSKGYALDIQAILGNKNIVNNRVITEIPSFENSYDTLRLKTFQMDLQLAAAFFLPVGNWATFKTGLASGWRYNQDRLLDNELIRIGGYKILRGFDEESLLTGFYAYSTAEFRILLDQNSYITLPFIDWGYVASQEDNNLIPVLGVGMGLNVGTRAGIFQLAFAAGRALPNPLDFSRMKVHFGYVNLF